MAIIDLENKINKYYDPLGKANPKVLTAIENYLTSESSNKLGLNLDTTVFTKENIITTRQTNCNDCGVFSCTFPEYTTRNHAFMHFHKKIFLTYERK